MSRSKHASPRRSRKIPPRRSLRHSMSRKAKVVPLVLRVIDNRALIAGGGAPEIEVAQALSKYSRSLSGTEAICVQAFADALEVIPTTLAENAGLNPIKIVTELRHRHEMGEKTAGVNVRKGMVTNILEENVIQPLLVTTSALELSAETLKMILKVDDLAISR